MGFKYKLVTLLFIVAICLAISITIYNFNSIVAPIEPVSAFRFENSEVGVYHLEFLGEGLLVAGPVINDPTGLLLEHMATLREKCFEIFHPPQIKSI
ncbi:MAG: hypothetical protein PHD36_05630 [Desulfotomaculaceae bacterium]|nr:hypothetical protein [Desulfotomaculaceae bacterium]